MRLFIKGLLSVVIVSLLSLAVFGHSYSKNRVSTQATATHCNEPRLGPIHEQAYLDRLSRGEIEDLLSQKAATFGGMTVEQHVLELHAKALMKSARDLELTRTDAERSDLLNRSKVLFEKARKMDENIQRAKTELNLLKRRLGKKSAEL